MAGDKAKKETFAIPDDEIDIRLIQQQIASVLGKAAPSGKSSETSAPQSKKNEDLPPLIKSDSKPTPKEKVEEVEEGKKPLPPTIDLFGGSNVKSPLRAKPPMDDEPEIVEIEHPIPREKITTDIPSKPMVAIPIDTDEPVKDEIKHSIPVEKLTPGVQFEPTIKIPFDSDTPVNNEIKHRIPVEKLTPEVKLEHSIPVEEIAQQVQLEHSIKEEKDQKITLEHSVRIPNEEEELVNTLEHSIPVEEAPVPQLEHSKLKMTINDMSKAGHTVKDVENDKNPVMPSFDKPIDVKFKPPSNGNIKEDSMDINELMLELDGEISLDLLNQLTNKINSEIGQVETPVEVSTPELTPAVNFNLSGDLEKELEMANYQMQTGFVDEGEVNINTAATEEEYMVEEIINQENEKTIVTEQICEYPVNNMDAEYIQALDYLDNDKRYKKYVVYIDETNQEFMDSLSLQERKELINDVLKEQDEIKKARIREERRKKLISILLFTIISIFVLIPTLFLIVNKCMEATIMNYRRNQDNWEVLFKEHNKIKKTSSHYY